MLNKKLLFGAALCSCLAVGSSSGFAMDNNQSYASMYGSIGGSAQLGIAEAYKLVTSGYTLQGTDKVGTAYTDGYKPDYQLGYSGSIAIGMHMTPVRLELEGSYGRLKVADTDDNLNDPKFRVDETASTGAKYVDFVNDGFSDFAGLLNVYYDATGMFGMDGNSVVPYIGGGFGVARVKFQEISKNTLAYQGKAGVTVGLSGEARFYIGYKYFAVSDGDKGFEGVTGGTATGGPTDTKFDIKAPYAVHTAEAGVIMMFSY